jgi:hypothetical protein
MLALSIDFRALSDALRQIAPGGACLAHCTKFGDEIRAAWPEEVVPAGVAGFSSSES